MKGLVKKEMSLNDKPHMQSFSGVRHVSEATKILSGRGVFVYAYLSSIDTPKSTGVVKYHLLYDTYNDDECNVMPTTSGYFEEQIKLPFTGGSIANPWLCESAANYLEGQWLKESALWSRGLVSLLKTANDKHIYDNNMHMEAVIKHAKKQPDRILNCGEPALYFHSRYTYLKQSNNSSYF